jgi:hypothetical protein
MFTTVPQVPEDSFVQVTYMSKVRGGPGLRNRMGQVHSQTSTSITLYTPAGKPGKVIYFPRNVRVVGYIVSSEA